MIFIEKYILKYFLYIIKYSHQKKFVCQIETLNTYEKYLFVVEVFCILKSFTDGMHRLYYAK